MESGSLLQKQLAIPSKLSCRSGGATAKRDGFDGLGKWLNGYALGELQATRVPRSGSLESK